MMIVVAGVKRIVILPATPYLGAIKIAVTGMTSMVMMRTTPAKVMAFPAAMIRIMAATEFRRAISPVVAMEGVAAAVAAVTPAAAGTMGARAAAKATNKK
jgi:hypothetical protein